MNTILEISPFSRRSSHLPGVLRVESEGAARFRGLLGNPASEEELRSLWEEADPLLRSEGLLNFGRRQEQAGRMEAAAAAYAAILDSHDPRDGSEAPIQAVLCRAHERMAVLSGRGSGAAHAEAILQGFARQVLSLEGIAAMGVAGAGFRAARLMAMSRLAASPAGLLTRGWGARALGGFAGYALEVPLFALAGRGVAAALGKEESMRPLSQDLASGALLFGGLRLAGFAAQGAAQRWVQGNGSWSRLTRAALPQAAMLTGILAGHGAETAAGWRAPQSGSSFFMESLATLLQFNIAGRLASQAFGPRFGVWEAQMDFYTARVARGNGTGGGNQGDFSFGGLALSAGAVRSVANRPGSGGELRFPTLMMMSGKPPEGGEGPAPLLGPRLGPEEFRIIADSARDVIVTINEQSLIQYVNPAVEAVYGYKPEELLGQPLVLLVPENLRAAHTAGFQRYLESGARRINWQRTELPGRHKSGREVHVEVSFNEFARDGQRYFTGVMRDITELKAAAAERDRLIRMLEASSAEEVASEPALTARGRSLENPIEFRQFSEMNPLLHREDSTLIRDLTAADIFVRITGALTPKLRTEHPHAMAKILTWQTRNSGIRPGRRLNLEFAIAPAGEERFVVIEKVNEGGQSAFRVVQGPGLIRGTGAGSAEESSASAPSRQTPSPEIGHFAKSVEALPIQPGEERARPQGGRSAPSSRTTARFPVILPDPGAPKKKPGSDE